MQARCGAALNLARNRKGAPHLRVAAQGEGWPSTVGSRGAGARPSAAQEHAAQISRLADKEQRTELIERAAELTHREVRRAVNRLLADRDLDVDGALAGDPETPEPLTFESRLDAIADLCRQLARALRNLAREITSEERELVSGLLAGLDRDLADFRTPGVIDIK